MTSNRSSSPATRPKRGSSSQIIWPRCSNCPLSFVPRPAPRTDRLRLQISRRAQGSGKRTGESRFKLSPAQIKELFRRLRANSSLPRTRRIRLGEICPPSSSSGCPHISGARTSSTHFARPRTTTPIVCTPLSRRNLRRCRDSASRSSARASPRTTSHCFESYAPTAHTSAASSPKMDCDTCSTLLLLAPRHIPLPTHTGISMAVKHADHDSALDLRLLQSSRTSSRPPYCAKCKQRSNDPAWDPKRCARLLAQMRPADLGMDRDGNGQSHARRDSGAFSKSVSSPKAPELKSSAPALPSGPRAKLCGGLSRSRCWCDLPHASGRSR